MAARQTIIITGITLAAVLAAILWYQLSNSPTDTATISPSPSSSFETTTPVEPTATVDPVVESSTTESLSPTSDVIAVQPSAQTGSNEIIMAITVLAMMIGGVLLLRTILVPGQLS